MRREPELAAARIKPMLAIAEEQSVSLICSGGVDPSHLVRGFDKGPMRGEQLGGSAESSLRSSGAVGQQLRVPFFTGLIAQCLAKGGKFEEALAGLDAAHLHAKRTGEIVCEPENHRLKGDSEAVIGVNLKEYTSQVLRTLTPREERVIKMRFGLEDGSEHTLEEVGQSFQVTRERIRQIEAKALRKLRHPSRSRKLKAFVEGVKEM